MCIRDSTYTVGGSGVVTVTAPDSDPATYAPVDFDAVGVTAVDDHTLTYTCLLYTSRCV